MGVFVCLLPLGVGAQEVLPPSLRLQNRLAETQERAETAVIGGLLRIEGTVRVLSSPGTRAVLAREGHLLQHGDSIETGPAGRASVVFRDASELRLFPRSRLQLAQVEEIDAPPARLFTYQLRLRRGGFWARFVRAEAPSRIETAHLSGFFSHAVFRLRATTAKTDLALSSGEMQVANAQGTLRLRAGERLLEVGEGDALAERRVSIGSRLALRVSDRELRFPSTQPQKVTLSIRLVDTESRRYRAESLPLFLRSNYRRIGYPPRVILDAEGFARAELAIYPPEAVDLDLNGLVYVWAVVDRADAGGVASGRILLLLPTREQPRRVLIDADSGRIRVPN